MKRNAKVSSLLNQTHTNRKADLQKVSTALILDSTRVLKKVYASCLPVLACETADMNPDQRGERATKGPRAASACSCSREHTQAISRSRLLHLCPSPRFCNQEAEIQSAKEELERRRKITHELQHKLKIAKAALEEQQGITETGCACETFVQHMHECVTSKHDGADQAPELSQPPPHAYPYNTFGNHPRS